MTGRYTLSHAFPERLGDWSVDADLCEPIMSTTHRPTFTAAKGRESNAHLSQQRSVLSIPQHTKLKLRRPALSSAEGVAATHAAGTRRDLKRELEHAEWSAKNKKRINDGLPPLALPHSSPTVQDEQRTSAIEQAIQLELDRSSASEESHAHSSSESDDESSDSPSASDEQHALLLELQKIKSERAAQHAALRRQADASASISRDHELAHANPLLNLHHALDASASTPTSDTSPHFTIHNRWDHDVIFKNQATTSTNAHSAPSFINDLTRSDFHKKFMNRYIK